MLCFSALLFCVIAAWAGRARQKWKASWVGLAALFVVMSMDELLQLHERINELEMSFSLPGIFHYLWVIPGILFLACAALLYQRFLRALPARTRRLVLIGAAVYLAGALGCEMLGGVYASQHGIKTLAYAMITWIEEVLEMFGVAVLIYGLLDFMSAKGISAGSDPVRG